MDTTQVRTALTLLEQTDSYLGESWYSRDSVLTQHKSFIEEILRTRGEDIPLGVYVNNIDTLDCLLITNNGIFSIYKSKGRYIPFNLIRKISTPQTGDQEIDVELEGTEFETISVQGETNGRPDVDAFNEFLQTLLKDSFLEVFDELKSVDTKEELIVLMEKHFGKESADQTKWRIENFETEFQQQNIDPDIQNIKGFWRMIGLWRIEDALLNDPSNVG